MFLLRMSLAIIIISWIIYTKKDELLKIEEINVSYISLAALLYFVNIASGAWRWSILLKIQNFKIRFIEVLSLFMTGVFFSLVIPGGAIGGDVVKAGMLTKRSPKGSRLEAMFTILMDRTIGMVALFSLTIVIALFSIPFLKNMFIRFTEINWTSLHSLAKNPTQFAAVFIGVIILLSLAGLAAAFGLYFHRLLEKLPFVPWILKKGDDFTNGKVTRLSNAMDLYHDSWKAILGCLFISIVGIHLAVAFVALLILLAVGGSLTFFPILLLAIMFGNTAGIIPLTPAGFGIRDLVVIGILVSAGMPSDISTAIPLIMTALILLFTLLGGLFFIFQPQSDVKIKIKDITI